MSDSVVTTNRRAPQRLSPDNFTPVDRTPWGGLKLISRFKADLPLTESKRAQGVVGESWELSTGSQLPSTLADGMALQQLFDSDPGYWLGEHEKFGSALLTLKWIDTADALSVQIHPNDDYAGLRAGQCGKPECWYVVESGPGAGLYIGWRDGVDATAVKRAIDRGDDLSQMLHFVQTKAGDFFLIDAGLPHAIGAGLTLIEPQRIAPGKEGVTYRYWDWNRRYDAKGKLSKTGKPRELHLEHALAVTDWHRPRETKLMAQIQAHSKPSGTRVDAAVLCGARGQIGSDVFDVVQISGTGTHELKLSEHLVAVAAISGKIGVQTSNGTITVRGGETAIIPAFCRDAVFDVENATALICAVT